MPPSAYGYGLVTAADRELGRRLHHSGGLPGYGSHVLLMPERGWGVMAFGNRTYAQMSQITLRIAELLHEAAPPLDVAPPSPMLARAIDAVVAAYASGRIENAAENFAVNFLLDMPVRLRNAELATLKNDMGEGHLEQVVPQHALAGDFVLACAQGRLKGSIVLAPGAEAGIQKLTFTVEE